MLFGKIRRRASSSVGAAANPTGERGWLDAAAPILERSRADHLAGTAPTAPYEIPAGHGGYGPRMILADTLLVFAQAAEGAAGTEREQPREAVEAVVSQRLPDDTFSEMPSPDPVSLISRHWVPGHAIEGS
ncbi:hypothetical protein [Brachybacterium fresconis]|uniref:Uncharacterized protein n=1 Tax=Brachybacterium fresconis TaxID=173363 RepID=A0ABS4YRH8_9MICO|nr:hypothetical protein [Brachybacterium fresconis]MBP2411195.1 hypothetical protein [Brachybacterium fresconis]